MDKQDKRERCCSVSGCTTKLSRYNTSNDLCFAHADEMTRARFEEVAFRVDTGGQGSRLLRDARSGRRIFRVES
jgi:hypothetical protein